MGVSDLVGAVVPSFDASEAPCVRRTARVMTDDGPRPVEPEDWHHDDDDVLEQVVLLCQTCPVKEQCLAEALRAEQGKGRGSRYGIFGATTPAERYRLEKAS